MTRILKISPRSELDTRSQKHIAIGCLLSININTGFEVLEDKCNNQSSAKVWSHTCKLRQVLVRTWSNKCEGNSSRLQYWCVNHTLVLFDKITLPFLADYKEESAIYTWFMNHDFSHNQFSEKAWNSWKYLFLIYFLFNVNCECKCW